MLFVDDCTDDCTDDGRNVVRLNEKSIMSRNVVSWMEGIYVNSNTIRFFIQYYHQQPKPQAISVVDYNIHEKKMNLVLNDLGCHLNSSNEVCRIINNNTLEVSVSRKNTLQYTRYISRKNKQYTRRRLSHCCSNKVITR